MVMIRDPLAPIEVYSEVVKLHFTPDPQVMLYKHFKRPDDLICYEQSQKSEVPTTVSIITKPGCLRKAGLRKASLRAVAVVVLCELCTEGFTWELVAAARPLWLTTALGLGTAASLPCYCQL